MIDENDTQYEYYSLYFKQIIDILNKSSMEELKEILKILNNKKEINKNEVCSKVWKGEFWTV